MEFKDRLKQYRTSNNLTQDELADKLFVSRQAISKYETGRGYPSIDVLTEIAKLMGISVDELITSEELTKETLNTAEAMRRNKKNILVLFVCVVLVVIISVVSIVISVYTKPSDPVEQSTYVLMGVVGALGDAEPTVQDIADGKLFGYCYWPEDELLVGKGYNCSKLYSSLSDKSSSFDMTVIAPRSRNTGALYEVYLDTNDNTYHFTKSCELYLSQMNKAEIALERDGFTWRFSFEFVLVDNLQQTTLYEYGVDGSLIKQTVYRGEKSHMISDDCLYVVVEEAMKDIDGVCYYNREMIVNSEINQTYFYTIKTPNDNGYCTDALMLYKY